MTLLFVAFALSTAYFEQQPNGGAVQAGVDNATSALSPGGNMEGKETRFGGRRHLPVRHRHHGGLVRRGQRHA